MKMNSKYDIVSFMLLNLGLPTFDTVVCCIMPEVLMHVTDVKTFLTFLLLSRF